MSGSRVAACCALLTATSFAVAARAQPAPEPAPPPPPASSPAPAAPAPTIDAPPAPTPPVTPAPLPPPAAPPSGPPPQVAYPYAAFPPAGPPPPPLAPKAPPCCRWAIRFDPFDLLFRRLSFQTELAIWGPIAIEAEPQWIFASPTENLDTKGGALQGNFLVYFTGHALNGFWAKASVGFEKFSATLVDPETQQTATMDIASPVLGLGIGSSNVFGDEYGFNLSGGVGIGFATAEKKVLKAGSYEVDFYDKASIVQLLASLGLGFAL